VFEGGLSSPFHGLPLYRSSVMPQPGAVADQAATTPLDSAVMSTTDHDNVVALPPEIDISLLSELDSSNAAAASTAAAAAQVEMNLLHQYADASDDLDFTDFSSWSDLIL